MQNTAEITIHIEGRGVTPASYDIGELIEMLDNARAIMSADGKPCVSYEMRPGSVVHVFRTTVQKAMAFGSLLSMICGQGNLDGIDDRKVADGFAGIQKTARSKGYMISFGTSLSTDSDLTFSEATDYCVSDRVWYETEMYFYGRLVDAGGKSKPNIHLDTDEYGVVKIAASREYLSEIEGNPLYREFAVLAKGLREAVSGEIDFDSLRMVSFIDYERRADREYLDDIIRRGTERWRGVDVDEYLREVRG